MNDTEIESLRAAIAALEGQRDTLGDAVLELAVAPLRARLAGLLPPAGLKRRQITVLFADVVGSAAVAQDPEADDTMGRSLRRMAEIVLAHQGRVLRFNGNGVKAAFGMDASREDDAERAVRAGLAILQAGREQADEALRLSGVADFAVRVGVHTGDVALGAGVEADNSAGGAAVNIAARMEQSAPPGTLRISHDTWNQVRGLFTIEPQPPLMVKGVDAPLQTYLVRAALDRHVAGVERGVQGLSTPMVGRDAELQRLLGAVARARETQQLQAFTLVGEAGLGKSRMLRELVAGSKGCEVIAVRSQPDGMLRPWGMLRSLLAVQFGVADTDSAASARHKVVEGLSPWFAERGARQAQLIGQLSGLDFGDSPHVQGLDPRALRDQAFAAVRGYLRAVATQGALPLLLVEDLHWADDGSLDLLQDWLAHAAELPMALIMTGRPALLQRRPGWGAPDTLVPLAALAAAQSDELARALLQRMAEVPAQLTALIVGQAEGNPYYMEELVRRLIDDAVIMVGEPHWTTHAERLQGVRLPGTLVGLLQARLDALPAHERLAARQASVIGHVFWDDALQSLDDKATRALPALERAAFVRAHEASDFEGTTERQFDHHLLHQVTYDTLLKAERVLGHGAAARWLAERTKGRGAEFLAMTGEHAERAGEVALAVDCFEQAGEEAKARFANTAAVSWTRRALGLLGASQPLRRFDLLARLERIADAAGERATQKALHAEMATLLEREPDGACQARLSMAMALLADHLGDMAGSVRLAQQTFEQAERCGAAESAAESQCQLAWLSMRAEADESVTARHIEIGMEWAAKVPAERNRAKVEAQLLTLQGKIAIRCCRFDEARSALTAVVSRGEALGAPRLQINALSALTDIAASVGQWDESRAWAERMHTVTLAAGVQSGVGWALASLGRSAAAQGDHATAIRWYEDSLTILRAIGDRRLVAYTLQPLADLHLRQGDAETASRCCAEAQALHQSLSDPLSAIAVAAHAARCELLLGRPEVARPAVHALLDRLDGELAAFHPAKKIHPRWICQQVLEALGDARAAPLLEQLHADVQASAADLTGPADRERLIQTLTDFRGVVAAYQRRGDQQAPA